MSARPGRQPKLTLPEGLMLRPWALEDVAGLILAFQDPLTRHYAGTLYDSPGAAFDGVQLRRRTWAEGSGASWAISDDSGQVLGSVGFGVLDTGLQLASVGYWLSGELRGRGLATKALETTTSCVFDRLGWHRIELYHAVENSRSCAVARRAGYSFEGVMREAMRYPSDNRWSDEHLHARLLSDEINDRRG